MPARVSGEKRKQYLYLRQLATPIKTAAAEVGVSEAWAHNYEKSVLTTEQRATIPGPSAGAKASARGEFDAPIGVEDLCDGARRALSDFEFFRARYFGRRSTPWQIEAGELFARLLATDDKEFVVVNCPPGAGKSTLLHDIVAWLICRDRSVRCLMGSRTERQAASYSARVKRSLERRAPVQAKDDERRLGLAVDAEAALAVEFGPFRPSTNTEIWRREQFTVIQATETPTDEKESTVTAFGMDSGQLGFRLNGVFWDDLVDRSTVRTEEAVDKQRVWYEDEAETRVEPGGLLGLVGQRIAANDLYRHALDMSAFSVTELDAEGELETAGLPRKYHHIVYPAHDEARCERVHQPGEARPWPDGCLLDPVRIPWRELRSLQANREQKYRVLYQQEDVDPAMVLVPQLWVSGGRDPVSGEVFPGCWDTDPPRRLGELPPGLRGPLISVASADPSPTKFWAVGWWVIQPATGFRFLMDLERKTMDAPEFLDWHQSTQTHSGLMESWQRRSRGMGLPIQWWVIEQNAAQRWLFQYEHFKVWQRTNQVRVIAHDTHGSNKADPEFGLEARLKTIFRDGLIRLPGSQDGVTRAVVQQLVFEATHYPDVSTDDTLMMTWFIEHNLRLMLGKDPGSFPRHDTPEFVRDAA